MSNEKDNQTITISRRALAILIFIILLLMAIGVTVGLNWNRWFGTNETTSANQFTPDIDPNASNWTGDELKDKSGDNESVGIKIPGYPSITLPANQKEVSVALMNPEGNPCYFTFELVLKDTNEVLYTSKMVPPGQSISKIALSRALPAGEYNATIQISTNSLEDGSAMNGANVQTVLVVQ